MGQVTFEGTSLFEAVCFVTRTNISIAHDFFTPNPIKNPSVFLLKHITHDWSDPYVKKILKQLRDAAGPSTKLVVMDRIIPFACPIPEGHNVAKIPGLLNPQVPWPLSVAGPDQLSTKTSILVSVIMSFTSEKNKFVLIAFVSDDNSFQQHRAYASACSGSLC